MERALPAERREESVSWREGRGPRRVVEEVQLVVFRLGKEFYGIDILQVREIVPMMEVTKLPQAPDFVEGIVNLRGEIVPIVDLRKRFAIEGETPEKRQIMVVFVGKKQVGVIVDRVEEVLRMPVDRIEPAGSITVGISAEFIKGIGKLDDRLIILLDIERMFSEEEKQAIEAAAEANVGGETGEGS